MRFPLDPDANLYKAGIAVGQADIRNDAITFRFRDELFSIPAIDAAVLSRFNGYFYEARVSRLRKFAKAQTKH